MNSFDAPHLPTAAKKRKKRPPSKLILSSALNSVGDACHSFSRDPKPEASANPLRSMYGAAGEAMLHQSHQSGLAGLTIPRYHPLHTTSASRIQGPSFADDLPGYGPQQQHFSLLDDPMMPANSSSSGDELDRP